MEIDREIYELLGKHWHEWVKIDPPTFFKCECGRERWSGKPDGYPKYSTDIAAAFKVIEFLRAQKHQTFMDNETGKWAVEMYPLGEFPAAEVRGAESLPLAICQAALKLKEKP